jgi:hypothetical protein
MWRSDQRRGLVALGCNSTDQVGGRAAAARGWVKQQEGWWCKGRWVAERQPAGQARSESAESRHARSAQAAVKGRGMDEDPACALPAQLWRMHCHTQGVHCLPGLPQPQPDTSCCAC